MSIFPGSLIRECFRRMKMMKTRFEFSGTIEELGSNKPSHENVSHEQDPSQMDDQGPDHDHQQPAPRQNGMGMEIAGASKR